MPRGPRLTRIAQLFDAHTTQWMALSVSIASCGRTPTILIENTSGEAQEIWLGGDSDVFAVDTIQPSESWCWNVPEAARRTAKVTISPLQLIDDDMA